jgi:hypothetical protein
MLEANKLSDEHDKGLRTEIIETEKQQADYLKWKFIVIAALASVAVGIDSNRNVNPWLLCLVPPVCLYVDLICLHLSLRIITIGAYLRTQDVQYENIMFALRREGRNSVVFEDVAIRYSSVLVNLMVMGLSFLDSQHWYWPLGTGATSLVLTVWIFWRYSPKRQEKIKLFIDELNPPQNKGERS